MSTKDLLSDDPLSFVQFTANGSQTDFSFSAIDGYVSTSFIKVFLDGEPELNFTFLDLNTINPKIRLVTAPASGIVVSIVRQTPNTVSDFRGNIVVFNDGSILTGADLNKSVQGLLHIIQEVGDLSSQVLGPGEVETFHLSDGCVTEPKLADSAVSALKIAASAVTEPKLADSAVSTRTIAAGAVTEPKLANSAVSERTITSSAVTSDKLASSAVTNAKIANDAVTYSKIQNVSGNKILCNPESDHGDVQERPCTTFGLSLLTANNSSQLSALIFDNAGPNTIFGNLTESAQAADFEPINAPCSNLLKVTAPSDIRNNFVSVARQNRTWSIGSGETLTDSWASNVEISESIVATPGFSQGLHASVNSGIQIPEGCRKFSVSFYYETANSITANALYQNGWVYGLYLNGGNGGTIVQGPCVSGGGGTGGISPAAPWRYLGDYSSGGNSQDYFQELGLVRRSPNVCPVFRPRTLYSTRALMLMNSYSLKMMNNDQYGTFGQVDIEAGVKVPKWGTSPSAEQFSEVNFRLFGQADFIAVTNNRTTWQFKSHSVLDIVNHFENPQGNLGYFLPNNMQTMENGDFDVKPTCGKVMSNTGVVTVSLSQANTPIYLNGGFRRLYTLVVGSSVTPPDGTYTGYDYLWTNGNNEDIYTAAKGVAMTELGGGPGLQTNSFQTCSLAVSFDI